MYFFGRDYEVVEIFFLGANDQYLEVEVILTEERR
jgi:hypothetical protein